MRIAQIAPLFEAIPPALHGGIERVVSYLTDALVELGHDVTLFASGDSHTTAKLEAVLPRALRLDPDVNDPIPMHVLLLEHVYRRARDFDVLHFHIDYYPLPLFTRQNVPFLTTVHCLPATYEAQRIYDTFSGISLVAISNSQRASLLDANWLSTIYHGLPVNLLTPQASPQPGYLAFLGRIAPQKQLDVAIRIALQAGMPIKIAAKIDWGQRGYFDQVIKPMLASPHVEYIGEISEAEKADFLGNAHALLFPAEPEPFGLVMIEAMACGIPVIAFRQGGAPEIVEDGVSGFIVDDESSAVAAVNRLHTLSRTSIRHAFETRFTSKIMAKNYVKAYEKLLR